MSSIAEYASLKSTGSWVDRIKFLRSLPDTAEIEDYLRQSVSYEDLQALVFLAKSTKNAANLLAIARATALPIGQRMIAARSWLKVQQDETQVFSFVVETMLDPATPECMRNQLLKPLHRIDRLKKSPSFFYNLARRLTDVYRHDRHRIDGYLLPYCSAEQIIELLAHWSITSMAQLNSSLSSCTTLIDRHPHAVLRFVSNDLKATKASDPVKYLRYFRHNHSTLHDLAKKIPRAVCRLAIEHVSQLEDHQRTLPPLMHSEQKYFFCKAPEEMIELLTVVSAAHVPGSIPFQAVWNDKISELNEFVFPRTFSLDHYIRLFSALYDTCHWSTDHTIRLVQFILQGSNIHQNLHNRRKRRQWLFDYVINQRIGREVFMEKLLKEGDETTLKVFADYAELTTALSLHLLSEAERDGSVSSKERLSFLRYQSMTDALFEQFLALFQQTSSKANNREQNYILILQCAASTADDTHVGKVLRWIAKQMTNERASVIEAFVKSLSAYDHRFQLHVIPQHFETLETIIDLAWKHLDKSSGVLYTINTFALTLLKRAERYLNREQREKIQSFATQLLKRWASSANVSNMYIESLDEAYTTARHLLADILVSDVFPQLLAANTLDQVAHTVGYSMTNLWRLPQIDAFIRSFFLEHLLSSKKLAASFSVDQRPSLVSLFIRSKHTRRARVAELIDRFGTAFLVDELVQRTALHSHQHRQQIAQLTADGKCVTLDKLSSETIALRAEYNSPKFPGLHVDLLCSSFSHLTGEEQERLTNVILHDFVQAKDVTNPTKIKAMRALSRFTHTSQQTLAWFTTEPTFPAAVKNHSTRTTAPLDHILICLPARFDLSLAGLLDQLHVLTDKLNAANAKYISDAMLMILRRLPEDVFLKHHLELIRSERFQTLGVTANKEVLRLLTEYTGDSSLLVSVIKPLWDSRPHQDVRACLILILLRFMDKLSSDEERAVLWKILEDATIDPYLPVTQSLFAGDRGYFRWPLSKLEDNNVELYRTFVRRIQYPVLEHPTSLEARLWAWSNIDDKQCDAQILVNKVTRLCTRFNKASNILWKSAFTCLLCVVTQQSGHVLASSDRSSIDAIIKLCQQLMARRDAGRDLLVYRRLKWILSELHSRVGQFDLEKQRALRNLAPLLLQYDQTFAVPVGNLLLKVAETKEDLAEMLTLLQTNLPVSYLDRAVKELGATFAKSSSLLQLRNTKEKLDLAQWFIKEKDQGLFVFDLLKNHVFNRTDAEREECRTLLRQLRQSENLLLRQYAMNYAVGWKKPKERPQKEGKRDRKSNPITDPDDVELSLFDTFDHV